MGFFFWESLTAVTLSPKNEMHTYIL